MIDVDSSKLELRLDYKNKHNLYTLRRRTKIETMNILCRWAFCISLTNSDRPRDLTNKSNSNSSEKGIEIRWETFSGGHGDVYLALLKQRCIQDKLKLSEVNLRKTLKLHVERGLGYLLSDIKNINQLIQKLG